MEKVVQLNVKKNKIKIYVGIISDGKDREEFKEFLRI